MAQVLLFTATMPEALQETAAKWQRKPVKILVAPGDMSISETIIQVSCCYSLQCTQAHASAAGDHSVNI